MGIKVSWMFYDQFFSVYVKILYNLTPAYKTQNKANCIDIKNHSAYKLLLVFYHIYKGRQFVDL